MLNLTGQRFGRLTVIKFSHIKNRNCYWVCQCNCGNTVLVATGNLRAGNIKSCKCYKRELGFLKLYKHGMEKTREYRIWHGLKDRCLNPKSKDYPRYGGRGIKVCPEWKKDFQRFFQDMGECPKGLTIDRIDNNGDYKLSNCRWATPKQQSNNQRPNVILYVDGKRLTLKQLAEERNIDYRTLWGRYNRGCSLDQLLSRVRKIR